MKDQAAFIEDVRIALYASKIVAYAQGLDEIFAGAAEYGWDINVGAVARIWRGGCIIRAKFLNRITEAYDVGAGVEIRVAAARAVFHRRDHRRPGFLAAGRRRRRAVRHPDPGFAAALSYYDGLRSERLPAALIQGQRDFFGAHTYKRVDKDGCSTRLWSGDRTEVREDGPTPGAQPGASRRELISAVDAAGTGLVVIRRARPGPAVAAPMFGPSGR